MVHIKKKKKKRSTSKNLKKLLPCRVLYRVDDLTNMH